MTVFRLKGWKMISTTFILLLILMSKLLHRSVFSNEGMEARSYLMVQSYVDNGIVSYSTMSPSCKEHGKFLDLLIMIPSRITDFERRTAIRNSWASVTKTNNSMLYLFLIGLGEIEEHNDIAKAERNLFNDIIKVNITDTDENEKIKSIAILEWVHVNCAKVNYLLKIKDSTFLNIYSLLKYLKRSKPVNSIIGCKSDRIKTIQFPVFLRHFHFWDYVYNTRTDYLSGAAYLVTGDILSKLYMATHQVSSFVFEDVYITGLCREYIKADAIGHSGFSCGYRDKGPCGSNFRYAITGNHYYPDELVRMWKELNNRWSDCRFIDTYWIAFAIETWNKFIC